ncbi:hypothetical protein GCM10023189_34610 [Nibrella saemangeumensis]|uniref:dTDP-4-dehydrorhamnose 3,5-epimerase n=1 Tax=Nibrella saemangeumensis TaxID=1084526 RepID=A0ABP8N543_9BACT
MKLPTDLLVTGNAYADGAPRGGWFVARFIDPEHGLRCRLGRHGVFEQAQGDFELKLFSHPAGHHEAKSFPFNQTATTMSMLIGNGRFEIYFCAGGKWQHVLLQNDGDYVIWAPGVGHRWFARQASSIFTVRCPAVDVTDQAETPTHLIPTDLLLHWDKYVLH